MAMSVKGKPEIWDDEWVKTTCGGCYATCTIRAHRVNGVIVQIEGEPDNDFGPRGGNHVCSETTGRVEKKGTSRRCIGHDQGAVGG